MSRRSPIGANWLLERFGVTNESLVGDLMEEYQSGRSAAWYWWQTLVAIARTAPRDVWHDKLLAGRAILTGWFIFDLCCVKPGPIQSFLDQQSWTTIAEACFGFALAGWIVAWTCRRRSVSMVLVLAATFTLQQVCMILHYGPFISTAPFVDQIWHAIVCTFSALVGGFLPVPGPRPVYENDESQDWPHRGLRTTTQHGVATGGGATAKVFLATAMRDIWLHRLLALRAIFAGMFLTYLVFGVNAQLGRMSRALPWMDAISWISYIPGFAFIGWAVARTHRQFPAAMAVAFLGTVAIPAFAILGPFHATLFASYAFYGAILVKPKPRYLETLTGDSSNSEPGHQGGRA
jgi:hypothetical protein